MIGCSMNRVRTVAAQAALVGGVAAWMTSAFANPLQKEWVLKDYLFVLVITAIVFFSGLRTAKYERLMQDEHAKKLQKAPRLEKIEYIQGEGVQLQANTVTCILFFGTWCGPSRAALQQFELLCVAHQAAQFVGLTQESREELAMYEVKGRSASNFQELKDFSFSIGIEDGFMSKQYLVRCDLFKVPQLFIVAKNGSIVWYGDPSTKGIEARIQASLSTQDVEVADTIEKANEELEQDPVAKEDKHGNAA